jgi:hypothetical protein
MSDIWIQVSLPLFWFSSVCVALVINVISSFVFKYLTTPSVGRGILNTLSTAHAVLAGVSWFIVIAASPLEIIKGLPPLQFLLAALLGLGVPIFILWMARWSQGVAAAQLIAFAVLLSLAMQWSSSGWLDAIPAYGAIAMVSGLLVMAFAAGHQFLTAKGD